MFIALAQRRSGAIPRGPLSPEATDRVKVSNIASLLYTLPKTKTPSRDFLSYWFKGGERLAREQNKIEASPATLLVESRTQQKSFRFLLREIGGTRKIKIATKTFLRGGER
ncbi:hypothetical protein HY798_03405 [Candidatus Falkowbacteria bacterium]|nr:hypothetical protein [Candidatus Falkowbacteria bacterium]